MNLKDMAHRILKEKSGTASGTNGGTFCPIETRQETPRGTARTRMNTGESANCPTVPNLYTGTVGHLAESGTAGGTASGTLAKQWGDHAHLVEWFFSAKDSLPRERFTYDQGEGWQVIWATPAASYENLAAEIEKGPGGQWDAEVRSILEQLHKLFGNKVYAIELDRQMLAWRLLGERSEVKTTSEQQLVYNTIKEASEALSPKEIADISGVKTGTVKKILSKFMSDQSIHRTTYGRYTIRERI